MLKVKWSLKPCVLQGSELIFGHSALSASAAPLLNLRSDFQQDSLLKKLGILTSSISRHSFFCSQ